MMRPVGIRASTVRFFFGVPRSETTKTLMVSWWHLSILKWICRGGRHVIDGYLRAEI